MSEVDWAKDWLRSPSPAEAFASAYGEDVRYDPYTGEMLDD